MLTANSKLAHLRKTRGSALLAVLWLAAGLAAIAFSVSTMVRGESERVSTSAEGLRAGYLAQGAIERGILWMIWGSGGETGQRPDGTIRFWKLGQPRMIMAFPSGDAVVEVIPEATKYDVNTISVDDLTKLLLILGAPPDRASQLARAIDDWRKPVPPGGSGAFDSYYFGLGPTFRPRHASIQEIEELLLVQGMTPELFYGNYLTSAEGRLYSRGGVRDCLSVWGSQGPFDVNTASPAVLEAVGIAEPVVQAIIARRQTEPFEKMSDLQALAGPTPKVTIGGGGTMYTLRATARLRRPGGAYSDVVRTAAATIKLLDQRKSPSPLDVVRYYDDAWTQTLAVPFVGMPRAGGNAVGQPGFVGRPARGAQ